jgi:hypothetical protein
MKNTGSSHNDLVTYKVQIDLNVFGVLMLHMVCQQINNTDVVTIDKSVQPDWTM